MSDIPPSGFRVVLTADRSLMADYPTLLDGMVGAGQTTSTPSPVMDAFIAPPVRTARGRAFQAPLGLRRVESALLCGGFSDSEVAVVLPEQLSRAVGPDTRILALSSGDPLGMGMNTSTMIAVAGGRSYTDTRFRSLLADARRLKSSFPGLRIVVGGPGAWQFQQNDAERGSLGIDHLVSGYCEPDIAALFRRIAAGEQVEPVVACSWKPGDAVAPISGPTVMGVVEVSRGCGLGCDFCTIAHVKMMHLSPELIAADVETNVRAGVRDIGLISEDFFRYGSAEANSANPEAIIALLRRLRAIPRLRMMQIDHANVSSVSRASDAQLAEIRSLLAGPSPDRRVWLNLGVETASGRLLQSGRARAKMSPFDAETWPDACRDQAFRLVRAGFMPMLSLVMGLPGETSEDIERTRLWVASLRGQSLLVFPLLMAPITATRRPLSRLDMRPEHWRLFEECYRFNFKWVPELLWQEQTAAAVPLSRRLPIALMGRGNVLWWKMLLALRS